MTAEEISLEMTIDPENLDYRSSQKASNYAQLFEQIETLSPEELLNKFKEATAWKCQLQIRKFSSSSPKRRAEFLLVSELDFG